MKKLLTLTFAVAVVACGESDQKISIGNKANQDKGMAVIAERQRALMASDKTLEDELEEIKKKKASSGKVTEK